MGNMEKIREKVMQAPEGSGARQIGECVLMVAAADARAAELIAADLDNPEMGLDRCFAALKEHARKHQKGGFWGCMCMSFDKANPVIQVICGFYKIPAEWFAENAPKTQALEHEPESEPVINLLDLL